MLALVAAAAQAASLSSRGSVLSRLRGGGLGPEFREEIHAKLNACPVFCILSGENNPVGVRLEDGTIETVWYTEPAEVMEMYESMLMHSESIEGLHVGCTPLGEAFALCGGWDAAEAGHKGRRIQGPREVGERASSQLVAQLQAKGLESHRLTSRLALYHSAIMAQQWRASLGGVRFDCTRPRSTDNATWTERAPARAQGRGVLLQAGRQGR